MTDILERVIAGELCARCGGDGETRDGETCPACEGSGKLDGKQARFDYRIPHTCYMTVDLGWGEGGDCGEPAPYWVWWADDESDGMWVCERHFHQIEKAKEAQK